jgi:hypothetical protein
MQRWLGSAGKVEDGPEHLIGGTEWAHKVRSNSRNGSKLEE